MTWTDRFKISDILAVAGMIVALVVTGAVIVRANRPPAPVRISAAEPEPVIKVHVTGEVVWPGVYVLKAGSRIQDAIRAAHGPTYAADLARLNLAATLRDGDRVVVPKIVVPPPSAEPPVPGNAAAPSQRTPRHGAAAGAQARGTGAERSPPSMSAAGEPVDTVNVNTATAADLERLPGVGPVLARRIVEHREAKGLFRQLDDLLQVKGIGPRLFSRLKPLLSLD
jgi:competence ComEA-like helix-hairpin-helix protein